MKHIDLCRQLLKERTEVIVRKCSENNLTLNQTYKAVLDDVLRGFLLYRLVDYAMIEIKPITILKKTA